MTDFGVKVGAGAGEKEGVVSNTRSHSLWNRLLELSSFLAFDFKPQGI